MDDLSHEEVVEFRISDFRAKIKELRIMSKLL